MRSTFSDGWFFVLGVWSFKKPKGHRQPCRTTVKSHKLLLASLLTSVALSVSAQGTAFTYQGQFQNNGSPANGSYDLTFTLYATNTTGTAIAGPLTNSATGVTNGLFAVTINFGSGIFTGSNYWLQIAVRTNGNGAFVPLSPRQALTPTPYAIFANTASNLSGTLPTAQLNGTLPVGQLSGIVSLAQLPASVVTNGATGVTLTGTFSGYGGGLSNVTATTATFANNANFVINAGYFPFGLTYCYTNNWSANPQFPVLLLGDSLIQNKCIDYQMLFSRYLGYSGMGNYIAYTANNGAVFEAGYTNWFYNGDYLVPSGGTLILDSTVLITATPGAPLPDTIQIFYLTVNGGGSFSVGISTNGSAYTTMATSVSANNSGTLHLAVINITMPTSSIMKAQITGLSGNVRIATAAFYNHNTKGVLLWNLGDSGNCFCNFVQCNPNVLTDFGNETGAKLIIGEETHDYIWADAPYFFRSISPNCDVIAVTMNPIVNATGEATNEATIAAMKNEAIAYDWVLFDQHAFFQSAQVMTNLGWLDPGGANVHPTDIARSVSIAALWNLTGLSALEQYFTNSVVSGGGNTYIINTTNNPFVVKTLSAHDLWPENGTYTINILGNLFVGVAMPQNANVKANINPQPFIAAGFTNLVINWSLFFTNQNPVLINYCQLDILTNNPSGPAGSYTIPSNNIVYSVTSPGTNTGTQAVLFRVPLGILTNAQTLQFTLYNNGTNNEWLTDNNSVTNYP